MQILIDIPKHHYENIKSIDSASLGRIPYKGIIMYAINAIKRGKALDQEPTSKNDLGVDCISREQAQTEIEMNASRYTIAKERGGMGQVEWSDQLIKVSDAVDIIRHLPSVTPQLSSELEKNSKKLEKDFGELDCISRKAILDELGKWDWQELYLPIHFKQMLDKLTSVSPQPCEDAVSRKAVINQIFYSTDNNGDVVLGSALRERIARLPSVTPQPRKGLWIGHREHCENLGVMPSGLGAYEWCSNCDCGIDVREWHRNHYNYCPNCGAKMVEPQESED